MGLRCRSVTFGLRSRLAFAVLYLSLQATLIGTDWRRPDHVFAFQMFKESSTIRLVLLREIQAPAREGTVVVPVHHGEWTALDIQGARHRFAWRDRVRTGSLSVLDRTLPVDYGASEASSRVQSALDDVAGHIGDDAETRRLLVDVTLTKNGRETTVTRLASAPRNVGGPAR
ncbi:MAG: hypothetical protein ABTD50_24660 [Polyangiaceae bacterium]|jgi:hypothetical protein